MNGFEKLKEKKKEAILRIVKAFVLWVAKTTISQIAAEAEVSQVTIYNHFNDKKTLLRTLIIQYAEEKLDEYQAILRDPAVPFQTKVEKIILRKSEYAGIFTPGLLEEAIQKDEVLNQYVNDFYQQYSLPLFMELVKSGQESGEISRDLSMNSILAYMEMYRAYTMDNLKLFVASDGTMTRDFVNMMFYGLAGKKS